MRIFGLEITRAGRRPLQGELVERAATNYVETISGRRGWFPLVRDWIPGAWQRNLENPCYQGPFYADFACKTRIAQDFAKLRCHLVALENDLWVETTNPAYDPVLRAPNHFQNPIQFWESWILSKLSSGNTYVLLRRDERRVVNAMYVLDYTRVRPLIADDSSIFYELSSDNISGIEAQIIVPARDVIHDRMNCDFHPLVGLPPIYASGLAALQGLNIQNQSIRLYENNASPGGILTAPGEISEKEVEAARAQWEEKYSGPHNFGKIAVLGNGMKFEKLAITAAEGQLIEQLKWTAEVVCSTYHVPPYKIGVGPLPSYNNVQALNVEYYAQCLQYHIEAAERCLDVGLGLSNNLGVEFDIEGLLRMDSQTRITMLREGVQGGILSPNEARATLGYGPVEGGASPMTQQQNYSLAALAKRDAKEDPFAKANGAPPQPKPDDVDEDEADEAEGDDGDDEDEDEDERRRALAQVAAWKFKEILEARRAQG